MGLLKENNGEKPLQTSVVPGLLISDLYRQPRLAKWGLRDFCLFIFQGFTWSDQPQVLRGQILLLHTQLMYERHKRELFAKRNRRLLQRIVHNVVLEERVTALVCRMLSFMSSYRIFPQCSRAFQSEQINMQENIIESLRADLKQKHDDFCAMRKSKESVEEKKDEFIKYFPRDQIEIMIYSDGVTIAVRCARSWRTRKGARLWSSTNSNAHERNRLAHTRLHERPS